MRVDYKEAFPRGFEAMWRWRGPFAEVKQQFSDGEIAALTFQIVAINGWNRLAVGLRAPVGDYVSPFRQRAGAAA